MTEYEVVSVKVKWPLRVRLFVWRQRIHRKWLRLKLGRDGYALLCNAEAEIQGRLIFGE